MLLSLLFLQISSGVLAATPPAWACTSVWSPGGPSTTACADASCNPKQANLAGQVLVLSVASMLYTHGGFDAAGSNPADCCKICKNTDLCNAWVFCNQREGCGPKGSCSAYINSLNATAMRQDASSARLPVIGWGSFGGRCNEDGTWPFQMCSLKQVTDVKNAVVAGQAGPGKAQGWISGVLPAKSQPAQQGCPAGLTEASCKACQATQSPSQCYQCALKVQVYGSGAASCIACASLPTAAQQDTCINCITNVSSSSSCSGCISWSSPGQLNVSAAAACFDCVAAGGKERMSNSPCVQCLSVYPPPANMTGCFQCASDQALSSSAAYGCGKCFAAPSQYKSSCMSCLKQFNSASALTTAAANCGGCATQSVQSQPAAAQQCYNCVAKASASSGDYCSMMGNTVSAANVPLLPAYYKCLQQPDAVTGSGSGCFGCLSSPVPTANAAKCMSCISVVASNPAGSTWCNSCWAAGVKDPLKCQQCLMKAGSNDAYNCAQQQ